ncbi:MAG: chemotaxis protein CheX [Synergistaceae bacterium]|jgi:chemotaxis protein CheX|nr:chemotaxis protein CheX [Synergistaceae bacterium]
MASDAGNLLSVLVNSYTGALISVSKAVGIETEFLKSSVAPGINAPGSRVAALIGIVGGSVHSTASLMVDMEAFEAYVAAFTGGMVKADTDDPMSMSVLGELTNMVSGQALTKANIPGLDITPPQMLSGENIKAIPPKKSDVKSFTLPFKVSGGKVFLILSVHGGF